MINKLIFVALNELNFDLIRHYVSKYDDMPAFKRILQEFSYFETYSEIEYENLEPWIQWVSAQTGKTYKEHGIFRLGDISQADPDVKQIFEVMESKGFTVGAISPMNASNKLKSPAYFIPDPWTDTPSDISGFSKRLTKMLRQTVNDNSSGKISFSSFFTILELFFVVFNFREKFSIILNIFSALRRRWKKAMVLDKIIHYIHMWFLREKNPDFSFVFFNGGAHIQHHYFLNSEVSGKPSQNPAWYVPNFADPVRDMLRIYNEILQDYLDLHSAGYKLIVATGLTQCRYERATFYYRLKNHQEFLRFLKIDFNRVLPRMTRDFEIFFDSDVDAKNCSDLLSKVKMARDGVGFFDVLDLRGKNLFVTLTYPNEIYPDDSLMFDENRIDGLNGMVVFVAVKNGMHDPRGFVFASKNCSLSLPSAPVHVKEIFQVIQNSMS